MQIFRWYHPSPHQSTMSCRFLRNPMPCITLWLFSETKKSMKSNEETSLIIERLQLVNQCKSCRMLVSWFFLKISKSNCKLSTTHSTKQALKVVLGRLKVERHTVSLKTIHQQNQNLTQYLLFSDTGGTRTEQLQPWIIQTSNGCWRPTTGVGAGGMGNLLEVLGRSSNKERERRYIYIYKYNEHTFFKFCICTYFFIYMSCSLFIYISCSRLLLSI